MKKSILLLISTITFTITSQLCDRWHMCMMGHMHHPPYNIIDWCNDSFIIISAIMIMFLALKLNKPTRNTLISLIMISLIIKTGMTIFYYFNYVVFLAINTMAIFHIINQKKNQNQS